MFTIRWLALSVASLISLASFALQSPPAIDKRVTALETSQAALVKRVTALESLVKVQQIKTPTLVPTITPEPEADSPGHEILSIDSRITESNNVFEKRAWIVVVQSTSDKTLFFNVTFSWLDAAGFIVDQDFAYNLVLKPHEKKEISGAKLVNYTSSLTVDSYRAETQVIGSK